MTKIKTKKTIQTTLSFATTQTTCKQCKFAYNFNDKHQSLVHSKLHNQLLNKFKISCPSCIISSTRETTCHLISISSSSKAQKEALVIYKFINSELGGPELALNWPQSVKMYALSSIADKHVVCAILIEPLNSAFNNKTMEKVACKFGVMLMWTHQSHRRKNLATILLDIIIENCLVKKNEIAFSQPTDQGKKLAESFSGENYRVYQG